MGLISTHFLLYSEINTEKTDIYEDAWGFNSEFDDVISLLGEFDTSPVDEMAYRLMLEINRKD